MHSPALSFLPIMRPEPVPALCESRNEYSMLPSMKGILNEDFYDLTVSWKDTIGGSNGLIIKNRNDWEYLRREES